MKVLRLFSLIIGFVFLTGSLLAQAPIANDDDNFGWEAEVLTGNLSLNDSNPGGGPITYSVITEPPSGSFTLQPNGNYSYTPLPEFNGFIYITVQACNSQGLCDQSILELAFLFVNDPPVILNDVFFVNVNSVLTGNVTANDSDIDFCNCSEWPFCRHIDDGNVRRFHLHAASEFYRYRNFHLPRM
jgi:Bacterial Ig domain